ncbi:hypothetical protein ILYODFUR_003367 [Ilyodon furcidens]|uniref:Uncharacterized protein n=1 Tax=Ilyodon furcidens TaxID=33524 RepID=A0ABV0SI39_9TELE
MLQTLDDCDSGVERDSDGSWSAFSSSDSGSESEPPPTKNTSRPISKEVVAHYFKQQCHNQRRFRDRDTSQVPSPQL